MKTGTLDILIATTTKDRDSGCSRPQCPTCQVASALPIQNSRSPTMRPISGIPAAPAGSVAQDHFFGGPSQSPVRELPDRRRRWRCASPPGEANACRYAVGIFPRRSSPACSRGPRLPGGGGGLCRRGHRDRIRDRCTALTGQLADRSSASAALAADSPAPWLGSHAAGIEPGAGHFHRPATRQIGAACSAGRRASEGKAAVAGVRVGERQGASTARHPPPRKRHPIPPPRERNGPRRFPGLRFTERLSCLSAVSSLSGSQPTPTITPSSQTEITAEQQFAAFSGSRRHPLRIPTDMAGVILLETPQRPALQGWG